ncbi:MAG TPA: BTAD domain-containing putative transcriptional regulator [Acidimicrobiales bacterium]|nr:BTAD domain-containing putative transcriptional regulator [Acidimicrobiales bacterium]
MSSMEMHTRRADIRLLGRFDVEVDGQLTPDRGWGRRMAAALVKLLALAPGQRLHREQVIDILWPDERPALAAPKLHKAAHYARQAAGRLDAVVLRGDTAQLFPAAELTIDVVTFDTLSGQAIATGDAATARSALDAYRGELLPDDRYEDWAAERRELLRLRHLHLLRLAGRWLEVSELNPADEDAHLELMRCHVANGDAAAALAQYERLARVLDRDLGVAPGAAAQAFRDHIGELVTELEMVTRRQAILLKTLAAAGAAPTQILAAAS